MARYLVKARPLFDRLPELRHLLADGSLRSLRPFGPALAESLEQARFDPATGEALWEEECYCQPPLAQERALVLDRYFSHLEVERCQPGEGWQRISGLPPLWSPEPMPPEGTVDARGPGCDERTGLCSW